MVTKNESSVLFALSELQSLENARLKDETEKQAEAVRQEERRRHEEREAARRNEELRLQRTRHEQLVAAEEARLRIAEEGRARELSERAQKLEQELRVGHAEREILYQQLSHFESAAALRKGRRRATVVATLAGLAVCSAILVAAWTSEASSHRKQTAAESKPVVAQLSPEKTELAVRQAVATIIQKRLGAMETQLDTLREKTAELAAEKADRLVAHRPTPRPSVPSAKPLSLTAELDACGNDPICGIKFKK